MKIKSIEPHLLSCPLPESVVYPFHGAKRTIYKRDAMVVRITTDEDLIGLRTLTCIARSFRSHNEQDSPLLDRERYFRSQRICRSKG
ncbi:MAG: hypothetical protein VX130_05155 [Verrucomicrobiota bacterium]|nr:hypothetical protein [Verrucomicrobiota bacterium]